LWRKTDIKGEMVLAWGQLALLHSLSVESREAATKNKCGLPVIAVAPSESVGKGPSSVPP